MDTYVPADINLIAEFLAFQQTDHLSPVDCIVLCGSSILHCAETIFSALQATQTLTKTLVICGGLGHSTPFLYDAIAKSPRYAYLREGIEGLPEASVLEKVLERHYNAAAIKEAGCRVVIETCSTNCGANAIETRRILESLRIAMPKSMLIIQDPTMSRRTYASFQKCYADAACPPQFFSFPTFVPKLKQQDHDLVWDVQGVDPQGLWDRERFTELVLGEIPRLRDDKNGYGPCGKDFIIHVDIPANVEAAWERLSATFRRTR